MALKTSIEGFARAIERELTLYADHISEGIRSETDKAMRQLVQETKATAPVGNRKKHYKNSISSKVTKNSVYAYERQWYVKGSDYRLSHLLNNGHALRDGGRYPGTQFITKAEVSIVKAYGEAIKEIIKNG